MKLPGLFEASEEEDRDFQKRNPSEASLHSPPPFEPRRSPLSHRLLRRSDRFGCEGRATAV